jgi:hypothetical protein
MNVLEKPKMMSSGERLLMESEAAEYLGISLATSY